MVDDVRHSPRSVAAPGDVRKSPFTAGHLRRWRSGRADLLPTGAPVEAQLERAKRRSGGDPLPLAVLEQAVDRHRDAHRATPEQALQPRPQAPTYDVAVPGHAGVRRAHLYYDLEGRLEARLGDALRGTPPYKLQPAGARTTLTSTDINAIYELRQSLESDFTYSTAAAAMALSRAVRLARAGGDATASFAKAATHLELPAAQLLAAYRGGTCMSHAEVLRDQIEATFGIKAHVVSQRIAVPTQPHGTLPGVRLNDTFHALVQGDTHTDVVVPYHDEAGCVRHLQIVLGNGPQTEATRHEVLLSLDANDLAAKMRRVAKGRDWQQVVIARPSRLMAEVLAGAAKLNIKRWQTDEVFGIDVIRRKAYMNGKTTMGDARGYEIDLASAAGLADLPKMLEVVGRTFDLGPEALADLTFLCHHVQAFGEEVLVGEPLTMAPVIRERDAAIGLRQPLDALARLPSLSTWAGRDAFLEHLQAGHTALTGAAAAVRAGDVEAARHAYLAAAARLSEARAALTDGRSPLPQGVRAAARAALARESRPSTQSRALAAALAATQQGQDVG